MELDCGHGSLPHRARADRVAQFIIEGAATVGFALLSYALHLVPNSPQTAWYLKAEEKAAILQGLRLDGGAFTCVWPTFWFLPGHGC